MDEELTSSPLPEQVQIQELPKVEYDLPNILREIRDNNVRVTRKEWANPDFFCYLLEGRLQLHKPDGKNYDWIINDGDLLATDWIVING